MKLSARNQLRGTVQTVQTDGIMAEITVRTAGGETLVSVITAASARDLNLTAGSPVVVVVKSTEVMLATAD
jgi:molybdate transport system regulatory protein